MDMSSDYFDYGNRDETFTPLTVEIRIHDLSFPKTEGPFVRIIKHRTKW